MATPEIKVTLVSDVQRFVAGLNTAINRLDALQTKVNSMSGSIGVTITNAANKGAGGFDRYSDSANRATKSTNNLLSPLNKFINVSNNVGRIAGAWFGVGAAISAVGVAIMPLIEASKEVEKFHNILKMSSDSNEEYTKNLTNLQRVADKYKLNVLELGKSYAKLSVATKGTVLEGKNTEKIFEAVAVAASAMQLSQGEVNGTFKAFIDMVSKGNVQAEELRGQLGDRLVGAFNMAAKAMGVSTSELNKMLKDGKVLAVDLLPKLAELMMKTFSDGAVKNAESLTNKTNYLTGEVKMLMAEFADTSGIKTFWSEMLTGLTDFTKALRASLKQGGVIHSFIHVLTTPPQKLGAEWFRAFGLDKDYNYRMGQAALSKGSPVLKGSSNLLASTFGIDTRTEEQRKRPKVFTDKWKILDKQTVDDDDKNSGRKITELEKRLDEIAIRAHEMWEQANFGALNSSLRGVKGATAKAPTRTSLTGGGGSALGGDLTNRISGFDRIGWLEAGAEKLKALDAEKVINQKEANMVALIERMQKRIDSALGEYYLDLPPQIQGYFDNLLSTTEGGQEQLSQLHQAFNLATAKNSLLGKLTEMYGSLEEAAKNGWGKIINATEIGQDGLKKTTDNIKVADAVKSWDAEWKSAMESMAGSMATGLADIGGSILGGMDGSSIKEKIVDLFAGLLSTLGQAMIAWGLAQEAAMESLKLGSWQVALVAGAVAIAAASALKATMNKSKESASQGFWTGGIVQGKGGLDAVNARLTAGEMVLNKGQQANLFKMLDGRMVGGSSYNSKESGILEINLNSRLRGKDIEQSVSKTSKSNSYFRGRK